MENMVGTQLTPHSDGQEIKLLLLLDSPHFLLLLLTEGRVKSDWRRQWRISQRILETQDV